MAEDAIERYDTFNTKRVTVETTCFDGAVHAVETMDAASEVLVLLSVPRTTRPWNWHGLKEGFTPLARLIFPGTSRV